MKQIVLRHALDRAPVASDFTLIETPAPACPDGGIVVRVVYLSLDPYVGSRLRGRHMGEPAPEPLSGVIPGAGVGQVIESRDPSIAEGDWVQSMDAGWREQASLAAGSYRRIDPLSAPLSAHVGILGMPGLTAWAGVTHLAEIAEGDTFLVDAAAGTVGGTAGQIARIRGAARIVGIAGGPEKCALVREQYGFDACIDYRAEGWEAALDEALGGRLDVHFENVSTMMANKMLMRLSLYGRLILCGLAAQYHGDTPRTLEAGLVIGKRARVKGLVVYDFYDRWNTFLDEAADWLRNGRLVTVEDRVEGLDQAPALFEKLMQGRNIGKAVVAVADE